MESGGTPPDFFFMYEKWCILVNLNAFLLFFFWLGGDFPGNQDPPPPDYATGLSQCMGCI